MDLLNTEHLKELLPQNKPPVFSVTYLASIQQVVAMLAHNKVVWDVHEFYHKQLFYNRCMIYGPNGKQKLTIPIHKRYEKTPLKDIIISYETDWQKIHWRSFEAAYRRSPYFEYYEDELYPLFTNYKPAHLVEWNMELLKVICNLMEITIEIGFTADYAAFYTHDYRYLVQEHEQTFFKEVKYRQVFEERHGFIANLSIIDLLFCEGPHSKALLLNN